jgi:hypothetical protein
LEESGAGCHYSGGVVVVLVVFRLFACSLLNAECVKSISIFLGFDWVFKDVK